MDDLRVTIGGDPLDPALQFRRDLDVLERAGNEVTHFLCGAVDDHPGLFEQFRDLLIAGLAVVALWQRRRKTARRRTAPWRRRRARTSRAIESIEDSRASAASLYCRFRVSTST